MKKGVYEVLVSYRESVANTLSGGKGWAGLGALPYKRM